MELLVGLIAFTVGLGAIVFPRQFADAVGGTIDRELGHRAVVAIRALGIVAAIGGFTLLL